jgi:hypothetical protein
MNLAAHVSFPSIQTVCSMKIMDVCLPCRPIRRRRLLPTHKPSNPTFQTNLKLLSTNLRRSAMMDHIIAMQRLRCRSRSDRENDCVIELGQRRADLALLA